MNWRSAACVLLYLALLLAAILVAPLFWLHSVWFIDDSLAVDLSGWGWFAIAAARASIAVLGGAVVAAMAFALIRTGKPALHDSSFRRELLLAALVGTVPCVAGIAGAAEFFLTRPFV